MFFDKLESLRKRSGKLQKDVAEAIGVGRTTYAMYEQGNREPNFETLQKIASYFDVKVDFFFEQNEDTKQNGTVPLIGTICAGDGLLADQNIEEYIHYPLLKKQQPSFALRVKGDSMIGAGIFDGDIVYMREARWADYSGQIVAALVGNEEQGILKRMKWSEGSNKINLQPDNPEYNSIEVFPNEILVCGVYMGHFTNREG